LYQTIRFRRGDSRRASAVCTLCAQDIYAGERAWRRGALTVCEDCFPAFARAVLKRYEITAGKELSQ